MSRHVRKDIVGLLVLLLLLSIAGSSEGLTYYSGSYYWGFQNYSYLGFNQATNFSTPPYQGVTNEVGYWDMNEGAGRTIIDESGNANNGTITGANWINGKFGNALYVQWN